MKKTMACVLVIFSMMANPLFAQRVKLIEGNLSAIKDEKKIHTEFNYDNAGVGKFSKESDYIQSRKDEYNKKEPGKGDEWAKNWVGDREGRYEPKFNEMIQKFLDVTLSSDAKYTIIFKTTFLEPGMNIGIARKSASINGEAWIVETANKTNVIAKLSVEKAPGNAFWGNDYDTGERLAEAYATAARGLALYIKNKN